MANYDLNDNKYLKNRLQFHAASRIGIQTGQALAQATNGDGHIVTHKSVWSAPESAFVKHTNAAMKTTSDGIAATKDLVAVFKAGAHAYGEDLVTYPNEVKLPANLAGKVFVNPAFPAVELYEEVEMTGVADSNGAGQKFEAYEVLNGTSRVKNFIPPTAVSDNGLPVPGYTGRVEVLKGSTWTDLENCGDVAGAWALSEGNWEFVYMSGMVTFHPDYTPVGKSYTKVRFTGFKYIGETLDTTLDDLEDKIVGGVGADLSDLQEQVAGEIAARTAAVSALEAKDTALEGRISANETAVATLTGDNLTEGSVAKAKADALKYTDDLSDAVDTKLADKVDKVAGSSLVADTEITKLSQYPEYSAVTELISAKANAAEVTAALADVYTKAAADAKIDEKIAAAVASLFDYKGTVADMTALAAVQNPKKGDVWHVTTGENGSAAEYVYNGTAWEELGTVIDLSAYATIAYVDEKVGAEKTRAEGIEAGLRTDVDAAAAKAAANETAIGVLNGAADVAGSVAAAVKAETDRATAAEKVNADAISENAALIAANSAAIAALNGDGDGSLSAAIAAEQERAEGVEEGLRTDVDANTAAIELLNGDATEAGSVAKAVKDAVDAEAAIARAAEQANAGAITQETTDRQAADGELDTKIGAETTRATGVEAGLRTDVDAATEAIGILNGASDVEGSVDAKVAAEAARATGIEGGLRTDVDTNTNAIAVLNGADNVDGSVAKSVKTAVDAEAALRVAGDEANATAISNEVARAEGVEAGFETRIAANEAALAALGGVEGGTIAEGLNQKVDKTTYATDKAALEATDTALDGRLDTVEGDIATLKADDATEGSIAKSIKDAVATEQARAEAAEGVNAQAISDETAAREAADNAINTTLAGKANIEVVQYVSSAAAVEQEAVSLTSGIWYIVKGQFAGSLPAAPADGTVIKISVLNGGAKRQLTAGAGDTILGAALPCAIGITEEGIALNNENYLFVYDAADKNWNVF